MAMRVMLVPVMVMAMRNGRLAGFVVVVMDKRSIHLPMRVSHTRRKKRPDQHQGG